MLETRKTIGAGILAAAAALLVFACSAPDPESSGQRENVSGGNGNGNGAGAATPQSTKSTTTGLPCDVSQVLSKNCQTCHGSTPQAGASTSLVTWDDLQKDHGGKKLYEVVKDRIHAETQPMPPAARLATTEIQSIDDWVAAGAPKSDSTCSVSEAPPAVPKFECASPMKLTTLKAASPFKWTDTSKTDQYMCFGVDEAVDAKRHVIKLGPMIDNPNIVHHVLLFQADSAVPNEATPCGATTSATWKLVNGWAPGGGNFELPEAAGFPEEGTTHWVLQVHYNNASGTHTGESDNSGFQLCSTDQLRANDASVIAFGSMKFSIPPRTAKYGIKCDYKLGPQFEGRTMFAAWPHMHTRGLAMSTERFAGGSGTAEPVFSQDPFSFENQGASKINAKVSAGDVLRTHCAWKNPGDTAVTFGEDTSDEMCFDFFTYYPAIPDVSWGPLPIQTWVTPSFYASCSEDN
jgi:hypothetical protein